MVSVRRFAFTFKEYLGKVGSPPVVDSNRSTSIAPSIIASPAELCTPIHAESEGGQDDIPAWLRNLPPTSIDHALISEVPVGPGSSMTSHGCELNDLNTPAPTPTESSRVLLPSAGVSYRLSTSDSSHDILQSPPILPNSRTPSPIYAGPTFGSTRPLQSPMSQAPLLVRCRDCACSKISLGKRADE